MNRPFPLLLASLLLVGCSTTTTQSPASSELVDYGDYSSETLTTNAWVALTAGNYAHAIEYTSKCADLYEEKAREMQGSLTAKAHIDKVFDYWALNDVGTSYFIMGEALTKLGRRTEAVAAFKVVRDELYYAQTWDPKGWFWSPAEAAYARVELLTGDF
ncbi:MAG: beta-glucanase precursor [Pseudomonadota bacterium]